MFYAEYRGTRIFGGATNTAPALNLTFSQNTKTTIQVQARDSAGAIQTMAGWSASAGIVGGDGNPTGQTGIPVLAAFTAGLTYDAGTKTFSGVLDCYTAEMMALIADKSQKRTRFAIKFSKDDGTERFEVSSECVVLAKDIESGAPTPASIGHVSFTVDAGQAQKTFSFPNVSADADLIFVKLSSGPAVDYYIVNVNEDDPSQNTVTVTLAGVASAGGQNFKAYVVL